MRLVELSMASASDGIPRSMYKSGMSPVISVMAAGDDGGGYGAYGSDLARSAMEQQLELAEQEVS